MSPTSPSPTSQPLSQLLSRTADAVQAVREGRSLTDVLARCPAELRGGTQALSFHVLRWMGSAQAAAKLMVPKNPPPAVDALLTTGIALLWPVKDPPYPDHTLVDQAVTAARKRTPANAAFVNAVLRRFLREREALVAAAQRDPQGAFNHPPWWIERVRKDWPQQWQAVLQASNEHPPMTLRVNARHGTAEAYVARLAERGIAARLLGSLAPQAVVLARAVPVTQLPGFAEGEVSVQDAAAQLAAPLVVGRNLPPEAGAPLAAGARVLDACAAPGGKTAHLLELADLDLQALDSDPTRLTRVKDTLDRIRQNAQLSAADARHPATWWDGKPYDAILLDAPCSASGIVRRHPDVRWLRRNSDIGNLVRTQSELLEALWPLLKPGGRLVYATCSLFRDEGQAQVDAFLQRHGDAKSVQSLPFTGHLLPLPENPGMAAGPAAYDGFFYALLVKT
ncbi:16S rRNA (cytosine(967)-C(5))-methyltransferase RsmB [Roseateles toxinivorans]|uniref:16S rRNA (cytosine(967)-C(5))-methyltransferase n=1 Tax=Roseateles toxinivorans TaxID=270368 RepID=A0A4R6QPM1_9BURK|nr:16S rRNA (cytosine(967)-C(5))-methyltransferase RsmB [Roseateles toxinivorans]TDP72820.1 16S rRNA (cytosine967-C5)-methyltransferase [Roseateles toxinivorans]